MSVTAINGGDWELENGITVNVLRKTDFEYGETFDDSRVDTDIAGRESAGDSGSWYLVEVVDSNSPFYANGDKLLVTESAKA